MKKIFSVILFICIISVFSSPAFATVFENDDTYPFIKFTIDTSITPEQFIELNAELADIGTVFGIEAIVHFIDSTNGEGLFNYAERIFKQGMNDGIYRNEGVFLVYSHMEKLWAMYTTDRASYFVSEQDSETLWENAISGNNDYDIIKNYITLLSDHLSSEEILEIPEERLLPRLVDEANLFTEAQKKELSEMLDEVSERQKCDIIIVTVNSLGSKSPEAFADDYYDYNGYGYGINDDGILFLLSMEYRDQAYSTYGFGIEAFTDAGQEYIFSKMMADLAADRWYSAFKKYIPLCDEFLTKAYTDISFDYDNLPGGTKLNSSDSSGAVEMFFYVIIILGLSASFAFFIVSGMEKDSKSSIQKKMAAYEYAVEQSPNLSNRNTTFVNKYVTRTARSHSSSSGGSSSRGGSSTHRSSSGRSHGGSSRKF